MYMLFMNCIWMMLKEFIIVMLSFTKLHKWTQYWVLGILNDIATD